MLSFEGVTDLLSTQWFAQLPFLILVSCGGGLIGALFNYMRQKAMKVAPQRLGPAMLCPDTYQDLQVAVHEACHTPRLTACLPSRRPKLSILRHAGGAQARKSWSPARKHNF